MMAAVSVLQIIDFVSFFEFRCKGTALEGKSYKPIFDYFEFVSFLI